MIPLEFRVDAARRNLDRYPYFYVQLRASLPFPVHHGLADKVRESRTGSRTPEYAGAMNSLDTVTRIVTVWSGFAAGLTTQPMPFGARHGREGPRFQQSVSYLWAHTILLLDTDRLGEEYENDLHIGIRAAERALALDNPTAKLPAPCPQCGYVALFRRNGEEKVVCRSCHAEWDAHQYELLCKVLAAEEENHAARG